MNSFWKGFFSLFDCIFPKSTEEQLNDLDNQMQNLYDRMGWGKYNFPIGASNAGVDITRVLEAEQSLMNEIYGYNSRQIVTKKFHNPLVKDPARKRVSRYYDRQQFK